MVLAIYTSTRGKKTVLGGLDVFYEPRRPPSHRNHYGNVRELSVKRTPLINDFLTPAS